jgi:hypothetical protein
MWKKLMVEQVRQETMSFFEPEDRGVRRVPRLPPDDHLALVKTVAAAGLKAKPELGIQFGAAGA